MNRAEAIEFAKEQQEIFGGKMGEFLAFVENELTQPNASNTLNALDCDDLISRKALYEKTAEWEAQALHLVEIHLHDEDLTEWRKWSAILNDRTAFKFDVADAPSASPRWIPVTERLPGIDTDVLISYRYKEGEGDTSHAYIDITSYGDLYFGGNPVHSAIDGNRIKHWRAPFAYFDSNYEVIAWMPLPQPWKGADDE